MKNLLQLLSILILVYSLVCCNGRTNEVLEIQEFTGPIRESGPAITYYSDSAEVKIRMNAPRQLDFKNGDSEFPEGIFIEFFEGGELTSSLKADYCYYTKKDDIYKANGNVVIKRVDLSDRLDTEELFWDKKKGEVFTEKFVRIEKDGELHVGEGLEAKQDFSYWKIIDAQGKLDLNQNNQ